MNLKVYLCIKSFLYGFLMSLCIANKELNMHLQSVHFGVGSMETFPLIYIEEDGRRRTQSLKLAQAWTPISIPYIMRDIGGHSF